MLYRCISGALVRREGWEFPASPRPVAGLGRLARLISIGSSGALIGGPVIPSQTLEALKKPFVRGSSIGAGGGLGLDIVDSVMRQIGGSLTSFPRSLAVSAVSRLASFSLNQIDLSRARKIRFLATGRDASARPGFFVCGVNDARLSPARNPALPPRCWRCQRRSPCSSQLCLPRPRLCPLRVSARRRAAA